MLWLQFLILLSHTTLTSKFPIPRDTSGKILEGDALISQVKQYARVLDEELSHQKTLLLDVYRRISECEDLNEPEEVARLELEKDQISQELNRIFTSIVDLADLLM